jgi:hypothetical protein
VVQCRVNSEGPKYLLCARKLGDSGKGAVYAYFDKHQGTLYVGQAGRPIKRRMHDELSKHKLAKWWKSWETVRFVQLEDRTDRLTLELLLVLALKPKYNSKPGAREISKMFRARKAGAVFDGNTV